MPTYNAAEADPHVVAQAYATARTLTNDPKILLSLFEAGLVESGFHNPTSATDRDSLGYLQQRPSQGWPDPTNIATATRSYVVKARAKLAVSPSMTAGQLAQAVQVSAYPQRYEQAAPAAQQLLARAAAGGAPAPVAGGVAGFGLDTLATAIRQAFAPLISVGKFSDQLYKAFLPSNIIRLVSGITGMILVFLGIYLLTKEVN